MSLKYKDITEKNVFDVIKKSKGGEKWDSQYKSDIYTSTNEDIQKNLNEIMVNLKMNYNKTAARFNKQSDIINRHQELVDANATKFNKQLNDLNDIQEQIALKTRIIEINEKLAEKKIKQKKMIVGFFVMLPLLLIPIIMITNGMVSSWMGILILLLIILAYVVYLLVIYLNGREKVFKPIKYIEKKANAYERAIKKYLEKEQRSGEDSLSKFIYGNCDCPPGEEGEEDNSDSIIDSLLNQYLNLNPADTTLAQFQEIFDIIGCKRSLNDNDIKYWMTLPNMSLVINEMKNYYKLASKCKGSKEQNDFCLPNKCSTGKYLMNANGPFMYYDGSAPPEQIYPNAVGSVGVNVEGKQMVFPREVLKRFKDIENPMTKLFFTTWASSIMKRGISLDDPRFNSDLDVVEWETSNNDQPPFWRDIKLPLISEYDEDVRLVCEKYNSERNIEGGGMGKFLNDTWSFFFNEEIPQNVYNKWLKRLNRAVESGDDVEDLYIEFVMEITSSNRFMSVYGNTENFINKKLGDMFKRIGSSYSFAEKPAQRML